MGERGARGGRAFIAWMGVMSMMGQANAERAGVPPSAGWRVWTETVTRRVLRDDPPGTGHTVRIAAARNEWESFQILMRSEVPIDGVNVRPGDLKGPNGAVLPTASARLYRQHQLYLATGTVRNEGFQPGWYPDALIPFNHPITGRPLHGARFTAVPLYLPAHETHGFWVDLFIPPDAPPGLYHGTYRVTGEHGPALEIPRELRVWDFQ